MRSVRVFLFVVMACLIASAQLAFAQSDSVTLKQAIQMSLDTHPQVKSQFEVIDAANYARKEAMRPWFPRVDVWLAYGREQSDTPTLRAAGIDDITLWRREASITARQILWDGMDAYHHVTQMEHSQEAERHRLGDISEVQALRTVNAYLDVLQQRRQVALAKAYKAQTQGRMDEIKERLQRGVGTSADVDQVATRLAQAATSVLNRQRDLDAADAVYLEIVGVRAPANMAEPGLPGVMPVSLDEITASALKSHPALLRRMQELESVRSAVKRTDGRFWPSLSLVGTVGRNDNIDGVEGNNNDASLMAVLAWNLFNGMADINERNRNLAVVRENEQGIEALRRIVIRNAVVSWNAWLTAKNDLPPLDKAVKANSAVVDAFEAQFGLGQRTLLDLLNVEASLFQSRAASLEGSFRAIGTGYGVLASYANVLGALGMSRATNDPKPAPAPDPAPAPAKTTKAAPAPAPAAASAPVQTAQPDPPPMPMAKPAAAPAPAAASAPATPAPPQIKKWGGA